MYDERDAEQFVGDEGMMWWYKATALMFAVLGTIVTIEIIIATILRGTN